MFYCGMLSGENNIEGNVMCYPDNSLTFGLKKSKKGRIKLLNMNLFFPATIIYLGAV